MKLLVKLSKKVVHATLVKENPHSVWVELPDGNVIKRSKRRHIVTTSEAIVKAAKAL
jgi:hypothetical protein